MVSKKQIATISLVGIVVFAGIVTIISLGNVGDKETSTMSGRLWILGNANEDDIIDEKDLRLIEEYISNDYSFYNVAYDANGDGNIDEQDLEQVKKLLSGEAEYIWYLNVDNKICKFKNTADKHVVAFNVGCTEATLLVDPTLLVGSDEMVLGDYRQEFQDLLSPSVTNIGDMDDPNREALVELQNRHGSLILFLGTVDMFVPTLEKEMEPYGIQVVRLSTWENGNVPQGLLTFSYLMGKTENAYKYLEWHDGIMAKIANITATIADDNKVKMIISEGKSELRGPGVGDYEYSIFCGANNLASTYGEHIWYIMDYSIEDAVALYQKGLELIVFQHDGVFVSKPGDAERFYNECLDMYGPYMNGIKIGVIGWDNTLGPSYIISVMSYAYLMYPELYSEVIDIESEYQYFLSEIMHYTSWTASEMCIYYSYLD
ncbi:MAG: dockerin type I domain-containing protein [Nitrososphaerota archaeon]|jgi:hypothetical protein|nr:dockerin type I domain-containing protein [Nitrososphaerota archaeon]